MTENYISIDLNDPRMKDLSEVLSNQSCKKILNLLAEKELTETEISKELKMPLNSVDYNIKKLLKSGLIESTQHWWSAKGKKMPSYKISNKKIIIYPRKVISNFIFPVLMTGIVAILGIKKYFAQSNILRAPTTELYASKAAAIEDAVSASLASAGQELSQSTGFLSSLSGWEWLVLGVWLGSVLFFVLNYISERRSNNG